MSEMILRLTSARRFDPKSLLAWLPGPVSSRRMVRRGNVPRHLERFSIGDQYIALYTPLR